MNTEHLISGLIGLATGALGSLFAPWIIWIIEKKKTARIEKQKLIENLRLHIGPNDPKNSDFLNSIDYIKIRPYLDEIFIQELEDENQTVIQTNSLRNFYQSKFLEEIDRIEDEWNLNLSSKSRKNRKYENLNSGRKITLTINSNPD